jgi:hypothetical protein
MNLYHTVQKDDIDKSYCSIEERDYRVACIKSL